VLLFIANLSLYYHHAFFFSRKFKNDINDRNENLMIFLKFKKSEIREIKDIINERN